MKRYYKFAGVELEVSIPDQWSYEDERTMKSFGVDQVENPDRFYLEVVEELSHPEGELKVDLDGFKVYSSENVEQRYIGAVRHGWNDAYIRVVHRDREHYVQVRVKECRNQIGIKMLLKSLGVERLVLAHEGVVLHASFVEVDGKAILFTAPSETGKSTQAELWKKYRGAEIINGDRAVIRLIDGEVYACGIPFAGSSEYCVNKIVPLEAIVYLGQENKTTVEQLDFANGFKKVWEGCTVNVWDREDLSRALDIIQKIIMQVPVYHLKCTPDESAVVALEKILEHGRGR